MRLLARIFLTAGTARHSHDRTQVSQSTMQGGEEVQGIPNPLPGNNLSHITLYSQYWKPP